MLFCEGFGHGLMSAFTGYWVSPNIGGFTLSSSVRHVDAMGNGSGYSMRANGYYASNLTHIFGDGDRWVHLAMRCNTNTYSVIKFVRNGENQASVTIDSGIINIRIGDFASPIVASSLPIIVTGTWYYFWIELDAQTSGSMSVYVNGNPTPAVTFSGNCKNATLSGWDQFNFRGGDYLEVYWADIVTFSASEKTSEFGSAFPELFIPAIQPSNDDVNTFSSGGVGDVNEIPWSEAYYASSNAVSQELIVGNAGLSWTPSSVHGVAVTSYLTRSGSIYSFQPRLKSGSADITGSTFDPMAGGQYTQRQEIVQLNPDTTGKWIDMTSVLNVKFGVKTV